MNIYLIEKSLGNFDLAYQLPANADYTKVYVIDWRYCRRLDRLDVALEDEYDKLLANFIQQYCIVGPFRAIDIKEFREAFYKSLHPGIDRPSKKMVGMMMYRAGFDSGKRSNGAVRIYKRLSWKDNKVPFESVELIDSCFYCKKL